MDFVKSIGNAWSEGTVASHRILTPHASQQLILCFSTEIQRIWILRLRSEILRQGDE
jgi:hypothetical protein